MAGTTVEITRDFSLVDGDPRYETYKALNLVVADVETLRGALDDSVVAVTELIADHATFKTVVDELKTDYTALLADVTAIRNAVLAITAKLDADGGVTDTNYAATTNPAALTATAIAASSPATLTAAAPSATAVDTAGDMTAPLLSTREAGD